LISRGRVLLCLHTEEVFEHLRGSLSNSWVLGDLVYSLSAFTRITILLALLAAGVVEHTVLERVGDQVVAVKDDLVDGLVRGGIHHHGRMDLPVQLVMPLRDETAIEPEWIVVGGEHLIVAVLLVNLQLGGEEVVAALMVSRKHHLLGRPEAELVVQRLRVVLVVRFEHVRLDGVMDLRLVFG